MVLLHTLRDGDRMTLLLTGSEFTVSMRLMRAGVKSVRLRWISVPDGNMIHGGFLGKRFPVSVEAGIICRLYLLWLSS